MTQPEPIRVFDSQGEDYKRAFQVFLDHTDQKQNAKRLLQKLVDDLPARKVFIDAGAGNGEVTRAFAGAFDRTIAIEPNPYLLTQLQSAIPQADAIGTSILAASPKAPRAISSSVPTPSITFQLRSGSRTSNGSSPGCRLSASRSS